MPPSATTRRPTAARYYVTESGIVVISGERSPVDISGLVV